MKRYLSKRFIGYTIFASLIAILEVITFSLFYRVLDIDLLIANGLSFVISIILLYNTLSKYVFRTVFRTKRSKVRRFYLFLGTRVIGLFLDSLVLYVLINDFNLCDILSKIVSGISSTLVNYLIGKYVFK